MKIKLLSVAILATTSFALAQEKGSFWKSVSIKGKNILESRLQLPEKNLFDLDVTALKSNLSKSPTRGATSKISNTIIALPNADGIMEHFMVYENSVMDPVLAAKYPEIKSYIGIGVEHPSSSTYFSVSPLGFKAMTLNADKSAVFIEPFSKDLTTYSVYRKSDKKQDLNKFECKVIDDVQPEISTEASRPNADDATLRTFRLAMSVTGEYTAYFGGTKALALAAINNSITRVNGVFEKDFAVKLVLIANTDAVIYTAAATDPYSAATTGSGGAWNSELQSTLTSVIGEANYDVGHLFGASGGGGNAGCIGCVCVNGQKGRGFTSPGDGVPSGDAFDIDYVAHELGHQFGGNHTFTQSNEGTGVQMEPGSGSTIMGYAGITSLDVQPNSDAYFHAISIQQVTNNIKTKTCQVNTATGNTIPIADAGLDYTIPKSTPFMLTGSGADANGDVLTYNWEQLDNGTSSASPSATKATGPNFRSFVSSTLPVRYFPRLSSVLTGATTTAGSELIVEALSSVARVLNFRLTVRDNKAGGSANNSDDMVVTVNTTAGPFTVDTPNTTVSYTGGSTQTVTWSVAGTTANGVNCANVDILLSTDGGNTFPVTLLSGTLNDGSHAITLPNIPGSANRIMVKGSGHIFFDVSNTNFTITTGISDTIAPTAPANVTTSGTTETTTNLSWTAATDNVGVVSYDVYQNAVFKANVNTNSYTVTGLTAATAYSFYIIAKDAAGNVSDPTNTVDIITPEPIIDTVKPSAPTNLVASGTSTTTTNLSWNASTDNVGVASYDIYQGFTFVQNVNTTSYTVTGLTAATTYSFSVLARDAAGNISSFSNPADVTTSSSSVTYCTSQGNNTNDERIGKVVFGSINNASAGAAGYENFTAQSTNVARGSTNTITITPTWSGTVFKEGYAIWIDYNKDGDFIDAGELVWSLRASSTTPVRGSITIPTSVTLGTTRMRVAMKYNAVPTSCESFPYGQVEDYTVNIIASAKSEQNNTVIKMYPNPTSSLLNITEVTENSQFKVFNLLGQKVLEGKIVNGTIDVTRIDAGNYILEIADINNIVTKRFIKK